MTAIRKHRLRCIDNNSPVLLSNQRFRTPLISTDMLYPVKSSTGNLSDAGIDIDLLKLQAKVSAGERAGRIKTLAKDRHMNLAESIWSLLSLNRYRRGRLSLSDTAKEKCIEQIASSILARRPIDLTMAFFPIKVRNPLKTLAKTGTEVDVSELGCLFRLYEICLAIENLYIHGARFLVSCDGYRYQNVCGDPESGIKGYMNNVQAMIDYLGIGDCVKLIDERKLYPDRYMDSFDHNVRHIVDGYRRGQSEIVELVDRLRRNIALVLDLDPAIPLDRVALAFAGDVKNKELKLLNQDAYDLRMSLDEKSFQSTVEYIAINWTMLDLKVFASALPNAVKATVHPKTGELGLYPINKATDNVFPHNGQGHMTFSLRDDYHVDDIRVSFMADLMRQNSDDQLRGVVLPPEKYPFSDGKHPFTVVAQS
ncbi:MAG: L-tyrosine/L-tryptophan isonitrile synthase family protein [Candidatus Obscuribacterales bacterium]|nr:L-tyrosine/L-tryptophan isonitrile synthase family protein [Candidatus Obscuribacterales bacterium]